jgi:hypothetical protein
MIAAAPKAGGTQVTLNVVVEANGVEKPVIVAEVVYWYSPQLSDEERRTPSGGTP